MPGHQSPNPYEARQSRLRSILEAQNLTSLVVTKSLNIYYLTGFLGSAGVAVLVADDGYLWVDPRYTLAARATAWGVRVVEERGPLLKAVARWLNKTRPGRVGFEDSSLTFKDFQELSNWCHGKARLEPAGEIVEGLRMVKDPSEVEHIRQACSLTAETFEEILPCVRPGVRESDLAAEIEYRMRQKGAEGVAFETIVASGPRAAFPHANASSKRLQKSELVIFDLGAILAGYAADMTRTLYLGQPSSRVRSLYNAVREAQQSAIEALRAGNKAQEADAAARRVLGRRGLAKFFTHSTGHGVGLEIHEKPRLGRGEKTRLESGCVVTAEPGIYLEGWGGIRIEDTVLVGPNGPELLTLAPKDQWFLS